MKSNYVMFTFKQDGNSCILSFAHEKDLHISLRCFISYFGRAYPNAEITHILTDIMNGRLQLDTPVTTLVSKPIKPVLADGIIMAEAAYDFSQELAKIGERLAKAKPEVYKNAK